MNTQELQEKRFVLSIQLKNAQEAVNRAGVGDKARFQSIVTEIADKLRDVNIQLCSVSNASTKASAVLSAAEGHLKDRAVTYDNPEGERSMADTVALFNLFTGHKLTETEGWRFMLFLKLVRSKQGAFKLDNHEDAVAYEALAAEALAKEKASE